MPESVEKSTHGRVKRPGGRKPGVPNKISGAAKDNIAAVFVRMGGTAAMARWAKKNQSEFYKLYARLLPVEVTGEGGGPITLQLLSSDARL